MFISLLFCSDLYITTLKYQSTSHGKFVLSFIYAVLFFITDYYYNKLNTILCMMDSHHVNNILRRVSPSYIEKAVTFHHPVYYKGQGITGIMFTFLYPLFK